MSFSKCREYRVYSRICIHRGVQIHSAVVRYHYRYEVLVFCDNTLHLTAAEPRVIFLFLVAFKSREVVNKKEYSERHQLGYAIYNVSIVTAIVVPVIFAVNSLPEVRFVLQSVAIFWGNLRIVSLGFLLVEDDILCFVGVMVTLLCLLLPKVCSLGRSRVDD